jgi:putative hydrolase of the HAD superfamily
MIKVIIFDIGGVYLKGSFIDFVNKSRKLLGIDEKFNAKKEITFDKDFNRGKISAEKCFQKYFSIPISDSQMKKIIKIWTNTWKPTTNMTQILTKLQKNYRLAALSNSDPLNSPNYLKKGWYQYFDLLILSHELGILKPDKKIYKITIKKLKIKPNECIFIDDQEDNLKPAKNMGMTTILFKSSIQLKQDLKKIFIKL